MDKPYLVSQLGERLRSALQTAHRANAGARVDARSGAARAVNLARGTAQRDLQARAALDALDAFHPRPLRKGERIGLGAVVEVENDEMGQTFFIAPVGAGEELTLPGGDGHMRVITPVSPFGRALMGKRPGDVVEVVIQGEPVDWTITFAA